MLLTFILLAMSVVEINSQPKDSVRPMAVAGQFYPAEKKELEESLKVYFEGVKDVVPDERTVALIVPHAGYVFSGGVAAEAYSSLPPDKSYEHVFLIGPSHHSYFKGVSFNSDYSFYETPLGRVKVDTALCEDLIKRDSRFTCRRDAHSKEHCLEVQLPFLQRRLKTMPPIVPVIIGSEDYSVIKALASVLKPYLNSRNLFVISSDFSHYPPYSQANEVDSRTADGIVSGDPVKFLEALKKNYDAKVPGLETSACGQSAIFTLMLITQGDDSFSYKRLGYRNSGDSPYGEKDSVVGYSAVAVSGTETGFSLSDSEKKTLLEIARKSISAVFQGKSLSDSWNGCDLTEPLTLKTGAFVTLTENGRLRGCIGHFGEDVPLYKVVAMMARSAAFNDTRFSPVKESELPRVKIEISALSPLRRIHSADDFHYGSQGIYMVKDGCSGTFLPQVADEVDWSKEEFLGHCAQDKAGIGWDGWKSAELYTYEAVIFKEGL